MYYEAQVPLAMSVVLTYSKSVNNELVIIFTYSRSIDDLEYDLSTDLTITLNYSSITSTADPSARTITTTQRPVEATVSDFIPDYNMPILPLTGELRVNTTGPLPLNYTGMIISLVYFPYMNSSLRILIPPHT